MLIELAQFIRKNFQRPNNGVIQLIIIHALVFIVLVIGKAICILLGYKGYYETIYQHLVLPASWKTFLHQPWSIFTYFWIHEQFFSIIWDSLFLFAFGQLMISIWHSRMLKVIYVLGGIVAGTCFLLVYNLAPGLQDYTASLVGPSGSLYAIMVATTLALPQFYFRLLFLGSIKIRHIAVILIVLACFELSSHQVTGIAHLAGGIAGYICAKIINKFAKYNSLSSYFSNIIRRKKNFKVTYSQINDKAKFVQRSRSVSQEQVDIDAILDKIAAKGYESLTKEERQQLFRSGK